MVGSPYHPQPLPGLPNAPVARDLRQYMTSVKDQNDGGPCNSCTAYAVTATVEGSFKMSGTATPDLDAKALFKEAGPVLQCNASHWWPEEALIWSLHTGLLTLTPMPTRVQIINYFDILGSNLQQTQERMMGWINAKGPVAAVMVQYNDFYEWGQRWSSGDNTKVYYPGAPFPDSTSDDDRDLGPIVGGHVVSIVGYETFNGPQLDYWICKNSWGPAWNGNGYVRIAMTEPSDPTLGSYIDCIDVWGVE